MNQQSQDDAVGFFSQNAKHFHDLYKAQPEYHERVSIWNALLDRYVTPGGLSLDMGCGPGIFTFYLAKKGGRVIGVDGSPDMVARCEAQRAELGLDNVSFVQARLPDVGDSLPKQADLVISSSVVEYVDDLDATLRLFASLVKPGGFLLISMPNVTSISRIHQRLKFLLTQEPEIYRHIKHFSSPRALSARVDALGLTLREAKYYTHYTRIAKLGHALMLPRLFTEDLFVAVFQKS